MKSYHWYWVLKNMPCFSVSVGPSSLLVGEQVRQSFKDELLHVTCSQVCTCEISGTIKTMFFSLKTCWLFGDISGKLDLVHNERQIAVFSAIQM